ncbi:MAG: hypothetical protein Q8936_01325 [Bacillota bacterium]|nr:hypothetical protein [Bacillota bacterium]
MENKIEKLEINEEEILQKMEVNLENFESKVTELQGQAVTVDLNGVVSTAICYEELEITYSHDEMTLILTDASNEEVPNFYIDIYSVESAEGSCIVSPQEGTIIDFNLQFENVNVQISQM